MTKRLIKTLAVALFAGCVFMQIGFAIALLGGKFLFWNIFSPILLLVAEIIIVKCYSAYERRYNGPRF